MSNNLYMAFHPGDYLTDTAHLSTLEHGAYLLLIMNYWQRGEALPADDKKLRGIARMTAAEWGESRETLLEFFVEQDGALHHKRIDEELERARTKSEKARLSAGLSHSARRANAKRPQSERSANQDQIQEQEKERERNAREARLVVLEGFERRFWPEFPNKAGRKAAQRSWEAAIKRGASVDDIMAGLARYMRTKPPDRPWLNPATFLNQERWADEPAPTGVLLPFSASPDPPPRRQLTESEMRQRAIEFARQEQAGGHS
jgi:uncharacterized protein YdaU (DUF1376 family)